MATLPEGFGPHLMLEAWECDEQRLSDLDLIFRLLNDLPDEIGMTKITQPHVFHYAGLVPEDWGITGHVVIAESHISIHTFAGKGWVFMDVFSCKPFDTEAVVSRFRQTFQPQGMEVAMSERGRKFPRS